MPVIDDPGEGQAVNISHFRHAALQTRDPVESATFQVMRIDEENRQPQVWERRPALEDLWGTSGSPRPEVPAAMAGTPDPGWMSH